ncbi:MAG: ABC transporter permease [Acuticoccus sp.]
MTAPRALHGDRNARRWRLAARAIALLVMLPIVAGILGVALLPAFGYLPALGADTPGFGVMTALLREPGLLLRSVMVSAGSGLVATAVSVVLTAAILAAAFGTRALRVVERLLAPILSVPHAAAALGFVFLFAPSGFLLRLVSPWPSGLMAPPDVTLLKDPFGIALTAALVVKETPFLFLMALAALGQVRADERVAVARTLGYGRIAAVLIAVWPLVYRQLRLPVLAVLAFSVSVVDMALILGPTRPPTLGVRILGWLQSADLSAWNIGSAAALLMIGLVAGAVLLWFSLEAALMPAIRLWQTGGRRGRGAEALGTPVLVLALCGVVAVFLGFAGLVAQSFAGYWPFPDLLPHSVSGAAWAAHLPQALPVLATTLLIALAASIIALPAAIVLLEAERRGARIGWLVYAPLIVPQVTFLFGLNVLAIAGGLTPGPVVVTLAHTLFTLPYVLIALSGPFAALDPRFEAVAAGVGAGPARRLFMVRLPMLARPLAVAAALSVAVSVGLYLPTQMLGGGRVATVTTEAVTAASAGERRLIGLFATLQLLLPFLAFSLARGAPALTARLHRRAAITGGTR